MYYESEVTAMKSIGNQIKDARKAKGMTQSDLANALFVSRTALANWEQDRRNPDREVLLRISSLLDYEFEYPVDEQIPSETVAETVPSSEPAAPLASAESEKPEPSEIPAPAPVQEGRPIKAKALSGKKLYMILASALVCLALLAWFVIVPALRPKAKSSPYQSVNGKTYTIEQMKQTADNDAAKAYLKITPSLMINHGDTTDYYIFDFKYLETNGIGLTVDRLELVYFAKGIDNVAFAFTADDLMAQGFESLDIPPYGDWTYTGGLPVQDKVFGAGELLHCTDENGAKLTFTEYIPFPET